MAQPSGETLKALRKMLESGETLKVLGKVLDAAVASYGKPQSHTEGRVETPKHESGDLFGNSSVDDGFDTVIALLVTLRMTSVAFQKMGADLAVTELKVTQEQAQQIVQQGEDQLDGAISGAVLQGAFSVAGAMQEFKGLKTNEMSLSEEVGRANSFEEQALSAEQSLIGPRQELADEVREVRLTAEEPSTPMPGATESLVDAEAEEVNVLKREVASKQEDRARTEEQTAEQHVLDVEASPCEPTQRHSQTVAKETARLRAAAKAHQLNHEFNFITVRKCDVLARLMTGVGEMMSRVAGASAELAKSQARSEETLDGRFAELWVNVANLHRDSAQKVKSIEDDLLNVVKALMNQQSELGGVVASKVV
ncbi:hypothetical protein WI75_25525 [Burkholderia ubonensis]|nr:hypothetical protein WI75_25525 [Burkholderia ubonensis]